jgi:hypothetical protein
MANVWQKVKMNIVGRIQIQIPVQQLESMVDKGGVHSKPVGISLKVILDNGSCHCGKVNAERLMRKC